MSDTSLAPPHGSVPDWVARSASPVAVYGLVHPRPGRDDDLLAEWRAALAIMRDEPGFEQYVVHVADEAPGSFVLYERWGSGPDLMRHLGQPYMRAFFDRLPELLARGFVGRWIAPVVF